MIPVAILSLALASTEPLPPVDLLVRTGYTLTYYGQCALDTDILEPAARDDSYLTVSDCALVDQTFTNAPTWIMDGWAAYGETELNGVQIGPCWLIHQELISNGNKAMTVECKAKPRPSTRSP